MDLNGKLEEIFHIVNDIGVEDEAIAAIMFEAFGIALNTIKQAAENENNQREVNVDEQIDMVSNALNIDLEALVLRIVEVANANTINTNKEADEETLDFITADEDIDDYETFLKENNITETLDELKKEV